MITVYHLSSFKIILVDPPSPPEHLIRVGIGFAFYRGKSDWFKSSRKELIPRIFCRLKQGCKGFVRICYINPIVLITRSSQLFMKADHPSDQQLQKRIEELKLKDPDFRCPANRPIQRLCVNPNCKSSLICIYKQCEHCQQQHKKWCPLVLLSGVTDSLNEMTATYQNFLSRAQQIENNLQDELRANRSRLAKELPLRDSSKQLRIIREIYEGRNWKDITGKMAKELLDELEQEEEQKKKRSDLLLEEYRRELRALTERLVTAQRRIYQQYSENKEESMEFQRKFNRERPKEVEGERLMEEERGRLVENNRLVEEERRKLVDQNRLMKIERGRLTEQKKWVEEERKKLEEQNGLVKEERKKLQEQNGLMKKERKKLQEQNGLVKEEKKKLQEQNELMKKDRKKLQEQNGLMKKDREKLQEQKKGDILDSLILTKDKKGEEDFQFLRASLKQPKKIELLYRGSQNQFRADLFHQKCDNTPDTFTLLRTEFGKVIGGFSHYAWNAVNTAYVYDEGRNAFLLSFDLKQKMVPNSHQHLIHCHPNCGPKFGCGHDLLLADRCNQNKQSFAIFPWTYNFEGKYKKDSQESWKAFCGATVGSNFKVLEYEVFRVRYE